MISSERYLTGTSLSSSNPSPVCVQYERAGTSPKRNSDGEFPPEPGSTHTHTHKSALPPTGPLMLLFLVKGQVAVLEIKDLEKLYFLSRSRLTLARHHPPSAAIAGHKTTQIVQKDTAVRHVVHSCHTALFVCQQEVPQHRKWSPYWSSLDFLTQLCLCVKPLTWTLTLSLRV